MRILILDDDPDRHAVFEGIYEDAERIHVYTAAAAIEALRESTFDLVTLDHDLELSHTEELQSGIYVPCEYHPAKHSGQPVCEEIARLDDPGKTTWVIHSWNGLGARQMYDILTDAKIEVAYRPFRWRDDREWVEQLYKMAWPYHGDRPPYPWQQAGAWGY